MAQSVDVQTQIVIERPIDVVAAYAADPDHAPSWYVNIRSVEWMTEPPLQVGSQIAFVAHFLGRRMAYTYQIEEWIPGERFVMKTAEGPFPMVTSYEWMATDDGQTKMTLRNQGQPSGFSRWAAPFMSWAMRRANKKDLQALKQLLETTG